ncbi:MAG: hypothetical protein P8Y80_08030 [Acidobacteriota bacterium]
MLEIDLLNREQVLKKKELEWDKLTQELELFMTGLLARARKDSIGPIQDRSDMDDTPTVKSNLTTDTPTWPENTSDEKEMSDIKREFDGSENSSVASIREMLLSQERRIENIYESLKESLKSPPYKGPPREKP